MPISDFPNEIFRLIFDHLPTNDILNCTVVCKSWNLIASPSKWRQVRFRFDLQNNKLASLLRQQPKTLENFHYTACLVIDLDYSRKSSDSSGIDGSDDAAVDMLQRIIANLPARFHALIIIFHNDAFAHVQISAILCSLLPLAKRAIHGAKFAFLDWRYRPRSSEQSTDVLPFFPMLTELRAITSSFVNMQFPPMPRLTHCKIEGGGYPLVDKMDVFIHSPLETLSLSNLYLPELLNLPHTITTLSLINVLGPILRTALFQFPNLRNLTLDFSNSHMYHSSRLGTRLDQPILSTGLFSYTIGAALPLWFSERVGEFCRDLNLIHFRGVLAKYSEDCSPFLRHFRERRRTSIINEQAKTSWEALFWGKGGSHFIFFDDTFQKEKRWKNEWQLRRSCRSLFIRGDIVKLQVVKNEGIHMTTFNEEERKELDSSGSWTDGMDKNIETCSKNAEYWELIRIEECKL